MWVIILTDSWKKALRFFFFNFFLQLAALFYSIDMEVGLRLALEHTFVMFILK